MTVFIVVVLTAFTVTFIAYPLFRQRSLSFDAVENERLRELYSKRDTTYSIIKELEFDFQSGMLTEEDYQDLETKYKREAVSILKDIDKLKQGGDVEEEIERQVLELRQGEGCFCPQCGAKCQGDDHFCSRCGTSLSQGESVD